MAGTDVRTKEEVAIKMACMLKSFIPVFVLSLLWWVYQGVIMVGITRCKDKRRL